MIIHNVYTGASIRKGVKDSKNIGKWYCCLTVNNYRVKFFNGHKRGTTLGEMTLEGFLQALTFANELIKEDPESNVQITTYSKYCVDSYEKFSLKWRQNGWKKSDKSEIEHRDLWEKINGIRDTRIFLRLIKRKK